MPRAPKAPNKAPPAAAQADAEDSILSAFLADWHENNNGKTVIATLRKEKPADYVRIALSLFAKEGDQESDPLHDLTDAELVDRIERIAASIGLDIRLPASPRRAGKAGDDDPPER